MKFFRNSETNFQLLPIFLRAIVLQTDSPNGRTDNRTFCVDSPTKPILTVFVETTFCRIIDTVVKTSVSSVLLYVGLSIY